MERFNQLRRALEAGRILALKLQHSGLHGYGRGDQRALLPQQRTAPDIRIHHAQHVPHQVRKCHFMIFRLSFLQLILFHHALRHCLTDCHMHQRCRARRLHRHDQRTHLNARFGLLFLGQKDHIALALSAEQRFYNAAHLSCCVLQINRHIVCSFLPACLRRAGKFE